MRSLARFKEFLGVSRSFVAECGGYAYPRFIADYFAVRREIRQRTGSIISKYEVLSPGISPQKYLNLDHWVAENLLRVFRLDLHKQGKKKILDIGTGAGYFPFICNYYGHSAEAMDLADNKMYNELTAALDIKRLDERITAFGDISSGRRYDLVTAFMICFNNHQRPGLWHLEEWKSLLRSLHENNLTEQGEVFLSFNAETPEEPISEELLAFFSNNGASIKGNTVKLDCKYRYP